MGLVAVGAGLGAAARSARAAAAPTTSAVPATTVASPSTTRAGGTTTTQAPARCDPVPPVAVLFVGTALRKDDTVVRFHIDEVRIGPRVGGTDADVTYVRDARFFAIGQRYQVTVALDPESGSYLSKVRTGRGEDPRCVARDPIYTTLANGSSIDTAIFSGLKGTRGKVARAFLLPLAAVVGALVALVTVKWIVILTARLVRRLVRRPTRRSTHRPTPP